MVNETSEPGKEVEPTGNETDDQVDLSDMEEAVKEVKKRGRPMGSLSAANIDETEKVLVLALSGGNYISVACDMAKLEPHVFYYWYRQGVKHPEGRYGQFVKAVDEAKAKAEARNVALVNKAAEKEWTAAAWWLERTRPHKWGKKDMQQIDANVNAHVTIKYVDDWNKKDIDEA